MKILSTTVLGYLWNGWCRTRSFGKACLIFWFVMQFGLQTYFDGWHHMLDIVCAVLIGGGLATAPNTTVQQIEEKTKRLDLEYAEGQRRLLQVPLCCPRCRVMLVAPGRTDN